MDRWATFDCYGTLIDWNAGIRAELARVFGVRFEPDPDPEPDPEPEPEPEPEDGQDEDEAGAEPSEEEEIDEQAAAAAEAGAKADAAAYAEAAALLERYHALERELERDGKRSYRDVMTEVMRRLGASEQEAGGLAASLPGWQPFPEVPSALAEVKERGWRIAILSNSDPDLITASKELLGVSFDETVVASEIRSYKPSLNVWTEFYIRTLADKRRHVHVGASLYHDISPAVTLRLPNVWINRLGEHPGPRPTVELVDLEGLPDALDSIFPA